MIQKDQILSLLPQDVLNSDVWEEGSLMKNIRKALLRIANEFYISLDINIPVDDVTFTGSLANFNYTKFSDIDLHLLIDYSAVDENQELVKNYMMAKKSVWNDRHDIRIKGYEVELYPQNTSEPHHSTGVYSILRNKWLTKPKTISVDVDVECVMYKAECLMYEIDHALQSPNRIQTIDRVKEKIRNMRQSGLERSGEFSIENLAFKILRRNGYLKKLYDIANRDYDASLSIKQENMLREYFSLINA
tara:strand:- start:21 stop:761 length:741 start_codon:yes stop_codon:yes gene_type:complete